MKRWRWRRSTRQLHPVSPPAARPSLLRREVAEEGDVYGQVGEGGVVEELLQPDEGWLGQDRHQHPRAGVQLLLGRTGWWPGGGRVVAG